MELTDIVSYLAFGRPASETLQLGGSGSGGTSTFLDPALGLAVSRLTNYIETMVGSNLGLGLDVFQFNNDAEGLKVTAGKYVRPRLYLAIVQPVSASNSLVSSSSSEAGNASATTFILEYEMFEELLLRLQSGVVFRVNLQWEHIY
jgi:translocation and assembly module TamB